MKRFLILATVLALLASIVPMSAVAQSQFRQSFVFTTAGARGGVHESSVATTHTVQWTTTATMSACTWQLETSANGTSGWTIMSGTVVNACTSSGTVTYQGQPANYVRINVLSATANTTGKVALTYYGYSTVPTSTLTDAYFWVPESACAGATTGTVGSGNATDIVAGGSGGARVYRVSATNASGSANTFTCYFSLPSRLTAGKGFTITDIEFYVSTQTTQPTSITTPTLKASTAPGYADPETASSATFTTVGGTLTLAPTSAQFAAYSAVSAGQWYTLHVILGTPYIMNTDRTMLQFVIVFNQSASAASLQETPGFYVHGTWAN